MRHAGEWWCYEWVFGKGGEKSRERIEGRRGRRK